MVSRLPIAVAPAQHEIVVSYLTRLATLHEHTVRRTLASRSASPGAQAAATATSSPTCWPPSPAIRASSLVRALPELREPAPDWLGPAARAPARLPALRRPTPRRPGAAAAAAPPLRLHPPPRLDRPTRQVDQPQPSLAGLPEVVAAQHRHLRLLRRLGPAATYDAVLTGFLICAHRWNRTETATPVHARQHWVRRTDLLIPPGTELDTFSQSRLFAATYPEAVGIADLIGSLRWRRLAAGGPDDQRRFTAEIGRRLGLRDYYPTLIKDPIAHWIEQDCWRPPSLPGGDYRSPRTFGGATFRRPVKDAEQKRRVAADRFVIKNRCGGDAILHHRSLKPIVIRDWSTRMELFSGALNASASTSIEAWRGVNGAEQHRTEYLRPEPAPSDYLDTAVEPVAWPQPERPRPPRSARPLPPGQMRRALRRTLRFAI